MMRFFWALSLLVVATSAHRLSPLPSAELPAPELEGRITNGQEASPAQFPFMVGIRFAVLKRQSWCGGTLISNSYVVTAAHCMSLASNVTVILGAHNIKEDEEGQIHMVVPKSNIIVHKDWSSSTLQNDITLIKLPKPVEFNERIQPAALPRLSDAANTYVGDSVVAAGWGKDSDEAKEVSPVLRFVEVVVMSTQQCRPYYFGVANGNHICVRTTGGTSTCNGDSGGPLIYEDIERAISYLVGITSFGIVFGCEVGWPAVFTRVTAYLDWIQENSGVVNA